MSRISHLLTWIICVFLFLAAGQITISAKEGATCDTKSGQDYICIPNHLKGSRVNSPLQQYVIESGIPSASNGCAPDESCVSKLGKVGKIGGACKNINAALSNNPNTTSTLNGMTSDNTSCFLGVICPLKLLVGIPEAMKAKVGKMTGLDDPEVQTALMCEQGVPSTFDPIQNKIVSGGTCTCIDPSPLVSSGITLLCTRYTSGILQTSLSAASILSKGNMQDGLLLRILKDVGHFSILGHILNTVGDIATVAKGTNSPQVEEAYMVQELIKQYKQLPENQFDAAAVQDIDRRASYFADCINCARRGGYLSGIGCVPMQNIGSFITGLIYKIGIGLAGAFTVLCSIYSAVRMQTSMGDAEAISSSRKALMSCLSGLALIILVVFIVRFIGADVLRIPGLQ